MNQTRPVRPPRLATACAYLGLVGGFQVVQVATVLAGWDSFDGQEQVKRFTAPLVDEGMGRGDAETAFRVYLAILAIIAATTVVYAIYTMLGHAVSRILLTITGSLVALACLTQGTFISIVLGVIAFTSVFQLCWSPDIRSWFAVLGGKAPPVPVAPAGTWPPPMASPAPVGEAPQPGHPQAYAPHPPRPAAAQDWPKIVAIIVLIGSSVVALGCGAYLLAYEFALDELVRQQLESGMNWMNLTETEIRDSLHQLAVLSWVLLSLCLVAIGVSTVLLLRRRQRR